MDASQEYNKIKHLDDQFKVSKIPRLFYPNEITMDDRALAQKRMAYVNAMDENLKQIVDRLRQMPDVRQAILFGSYARGRRDLFTDLDIIVVMDTELDFIQRTANLYQALNIGVDLDLLVYTPDEFEIMRTRAFIRHALEGSEVIYAKPSSG